MIAEFVPAMSLAIVWVTDDPSVSNNCAHKRSYVGFLNCSCEYDGVHGRKSPHSLNRWPANTVGVSGSGNGFAK